MEGKPVSVYAITGLYVENYIKISSMSKAAKPTAHAIVVEIDHTRICSFVSVMPLKRFTTQ